METPLTMAGPIHKGHSKMAHGTQHRAAQYFDLPDFHPQNPQDPKDPLSMSRCQVAQDTLRGPCPFPGRSELSFWHERDQLHIRKVYLMPQLISVYNQIIFKAQSKAGLHNKMTVCIQFYGTYVEQNI